MSAERDLRNFFEKKFLKNLQKTFLLLLSFVGLRVKIVLTDGHRVFAVGGDPASRGDAAVEEEEDRGVEREALKAELCCDHARFGRLAVDAARRCGGELNSADPVEDDLIDRVGEVAAPRAVDDDGADGKLTDEGLAPRLG